MREFRCTTHIGTGFDRSDDRIYQYVEFARSYEDAVNQAADTVIRFTNGQITRNDIRLIETVEVDKFGRPVEVY